MAARTSPRAMAARTSPAPRRSAPVRRPPRRSAPPWPPRRVRPTATPSSSGGASRPGKKNDASASRRGRARRSGASKHPYTRKKRRPRRASRRPGCAPRIAPPAWAQRLEARVQAEEERSWGAPPDWGESRPWASPREVELRLWLSANVGSPARRRAVLDVAECLDDLRYCEWDALEHHLALADWPALLRGGASWWRSARCARPRRPTRPRRRWPTPGPTTPKAATRPGPRGPTRRPPRTTARGARERVDAAIAAARAMPRARSESVSSESSDEAARRRRRGDDAESDSDDESDGAMPPLEDAADGCVPPVPWRAESIVRRLAAAPPDEAACCPICLDALGGDVVEMPCRWLEHEDRAVPHAFHRDCALELLNASASRGERVPRCPTCRDDFPPHLLVAHPEDL